MTIRLFPSPARRPGTARLKRWAGLVFPAVLLAALMLSCQMAQATPVPKSPTTFTPEDCSLPGVDFNEVTAAYLTDETYAGPYLICSTIQQGAHASIDYYVSVTAYQPARLEDFYNDVKASNASFVDQAAEWNAKPEVPPEAQDNVTMIRNDENGYIFVITEEANVQDCWRGSGYGVEKVNGKYLVSFHYLSCELTSDSAYVDMMANMEGVALNAINRLAAETGGTR